MGIRFADWPFEEDEQVDLHWLRSPYQAGEKRQWKMRAVFKRADSSLHELEVAWGALPMLRLGSAYRGGKQIGNMTLGTPTKIRFSPNARSKICSGFSVPAQYGLSAEDVQERCVVVWEGGRQIVIPCLEIIRAYFALNRMMADELLRPDSFNGLCIAKITNGEAHLEFSSYAAAAALDPEIVRRITLIHFDRNFSNSWRRVWASSADQVDSVLQTEPPALAGSNWDVVGINFGQTILVLQIRQFTSAVHLLFRSISYTHPSFRKYEGARALGSDGNQVVTQEKPDVVSIASGTESPSKQSRPQLVKIGYTTANFSTQIELTKIQEIVRRASDDITGRLGGGRGTIVQRDPVKECTLNGESGFGELPSAEFRHFESMEDIPPQFRRIFSALNHIEQAFISYVEGGAPTGCSLPRFPTGSDMPRPYVLVCVSIPGRRFYLVEVDVSDGHSISTLVFVLKEDQQIEYSLGKVLKDGVVGGGHWDRTKLESLFGRGRFELVKHTKSSSASWGQRLLGAGKTALRYL